MRILLPLLPALMASLMLAHNTSAESSEEKTPDSGTTTETQPLTPAERIEKEKEAKARLEELRLKVESNIAPLIESLKLSRSQKARVNALMGEEQWEAAIDAFKTTREPEIQDHAHKLAQTTIPGMMRKFMPTYMQKKVMAQRQKEGRRGPPSRDEIAKIQGDAQSKMRPAMQKVVMPGLESLTDTRVEELLNDEKVLTRMLADRILKGRILDDTDAKKFSEALTEAGYPESLTIGEDAVLNDRMKKMIDDIDIAKVAESAGL